MTYFRYQLQTYSGIKSRHTCPCCEQKKEFTLYIDKETGEVLPVHVGMCNRRNTCGYHYAPKQYFKDNNITPTKSFLQNLPEKPQVKTKTSFIPEEIFEKSGSEFQDPLSNKFIKWLLINYSLDKVNDVLTKYQIGTSNKWPGAVVFWQIDQDLNKHTGKIMLYDPLTGKRIKVPSSHITWAHRVYNLPDFQLQQCLFGEHLLSERQNDGKTIAIVESEKTAIIASIEFPDYIWLSTGGMNGAKWYLPEVNKCLLNRKVILFPDLGAYDKWFVDARSLKAVGINIKVNRILEDQATDTERMAGYDLADYLIDQKLSQASTSKI